MFKLMVKKIITVTHSYLIQIKRISKIKFISVPELVLILVFSANPGKLRQNAAFHLGLLCLPDILPSLLITDLIQKNILT